MMVVFNSYMAYFTTHLTNRLIALATTSMHALTITISDVPHHGRSDPSSSRDEEFEFKSPMVQEESYKGPITRSKTKFDNLVIYFDSKEACESKGLRVNQETCRFSNDINTRNQA